MKKGIGLGGVLVLLIFAVFVYGLVNPTSSPTKKAPPVPTTKVDVEKKTQLLLGELKKIPANELIENFDRYEQLVHMHPSEQKYKDKMNHYKGKLDRVIMIEKQFSAWDGSHTEFTRYIKNNLKNPDSFDHVKTVYVDKGEYVLIETTYRATNSFNAITTSKAYAEASIDGANLKIIAID